MSHSERGNSFVKQAAILAAASMLVRFIGFLYRVPMTAIIGDEGNAVYSAGYQVYNFLLILSSAGLPAAIAKMVSERLALKEYQNAHKVFRVSLVFSGTLSFVFMVILIVFARSIAINICKIPDAYYTLLTLAPTIFIVGIMAVFRGYFQGMNNMIPTAVSQIIEQIFHAVFSVFLAWLFIDNSIALAAAGGTSGTGIGALAALSVIFMAYGLNRKKIKRRLSLPSDGYEVESSVTIIKILLKTAVPIIIGTAIYSITNLVDMSMVMGRLMDSGAFTHEEATILYGQLQGKYVTITTLPVAISTAIATASIPSIAGSMVLKEYDAVERKINTAIKISMVISIPAAIGIAVLAPQILLMIFPTAPGGGTLLRIGAFSIIFLALSQIVTGTLQGIGKVKVPARNAAVGAVAKIVANYFLIVIPFFNINGAVIATIICYLVASTLNLRALIKATGFTPDMVAILVKPTIASLIMGVVCFGSYEICDIFFGNTISTLASIGVSVVVYFVIMLVIKGITESDIRLLPAGGKLVAISRKLKLLK